MRRRTFLAAALALPAWKPVVPAVGRLLVVDSVGAALLAFDERTLARVGRVPLGSRPREIALSPDGRTAYVTIYGTGVYGNNPRPGREVAAVNVRTLRVEKRISIAPFAGPHGIAVAPDGLLWATCETEGALLVIDPAARNPSRAVIASVPLGVKGPHWLAITPDGSKVYATSRANPVLSVVDAGRRKLIAEINTPRGLEGLAIAPDGRRLFAADLTRPTLWAVNASDDVAVKEHPLDEPATRVLALPDGSGLIAAHEASGTVEVLELPSLRRRGVVNVGKAPSGLATSADSRTGYIGSWGGGTVAVLDLKSLRVVRTVEVGGGPDGLILAPGATL